jgi:hypothetical protein
MDKKVILSLCRFATPKLYKKEASAISWGRFQPKLLLHARPSAQRSMGPTGIESPPIPLKPLQTEQALNIYIEIERIRNLSVSKST